MPRLYQDYYMDCFSAPHCNISETDTLILESFGAIPQNKAP